MFLFHIHHLHKLTMFTTTKKQQPCRTSFLFDFLMKQIFYTKNINIADQECAKYLVFVWIKICEMNTSEGRKVKSVKIKKAQ